MQRPERVAAVEKIEDKRKLDDFFGHRNRRRFASRNTAPLSSRTRTPAGKDNIPPPGEGDVRACEDRGWNGVHRNTEKVCNHAGKVSLSPAFHPLGSLRSPVPLPWRGYMPAVHTGRRGNRSLTAKNLIHNSPAQLCQYLSSPKEAFYGILRKNDPHNQNRP